MRVEVDSRVADRFEGISQPAKPVELTIKQFAERLPFLRAAQNPFAPFLGVINVLVRGRNIEIAQHHELVVPRYLVFEKTL